MAEKRIGDVRTGIVDSNGNPVSSRSRNNVLGDKRHIPLYFNEEDDAQAYFSYPAKTGVYRPTDTKGNLNLIRRADWATLPSSFKSGRDNVLYDTIVPIHIREFQPKFSSTLNNVFHVSNQIGQLAETLSNSINDKKSFGEIINIYNNNPISNSFQAFQTGFEYTLPYLQIQEQAFATEFGGGENGQESLLSKVTGFVKDRVINNPAVGGGKLSFIDKASVFGGDFAKSAGSTIFPAINPASPKNQFYSGSSPVGYTITIDLLNTINHETAKFHKELVELWSHNMGMGNLRNPWVGDSPCIYTIEIPNIRWCPACKIDFSYVGNGNLTYIDGVPFPESYTCTFAVTEFFPPIRTIHHHYIHRGEKFTAITTDRNFCNNISETTRTISNSLSKIANAFRRT